MESFVIPSDTPGYAEYAQLIASQARLETKIDMVLQRLDVQDSDLRNMRTRVEDLEKSRAHSKGILAALTALGGIVGGVVSAVVKTWLPH